VRGDRENKRKRQTAARGESLGSIQLTSPNQLLHLTRNLPRSLTHTLSHIGPASLRTCTCKQRIPVRGSSSMDGGRERERERAGAQSPPLSLGECSYVPGQRRRSSSTSYRRHPLAPLHPRNPRREAEASSRGAHPVDQLNTARETASEYIKRTGVSISSAQLAFVRRCLRIIF
jgi:hypothetical protein